MDRLNESDPGLTDDSDGLPSLICSSGERPGHRSPLCSSSPLGGEGHAKFPDRLARAICEAHLGKGKRKGKGTGKGNGKKDKGDGKGNTDIGGVGRTVARGDGLRAMESKSPSLVLQKIRICICNPMQTKPSQTNPIQFGQIWFQSNLVPIRHNRFRIH